MAPTYSNGQEMVSVFFAIKSHIYSLYDELLDLKKSYYYEKYSMSSVYKRKHCIQRTISFFQILCMQSPPQNESKVTFMFENNNSVNFM